MSFDDFSKINNFMDSDKPSESSGLRRSKRRNKFHLDVAAMLAGNNPDRRLSPQPHHQTTLDNQTFIVPSKQSKRSIQKLLKPKLNNTLQSVKLTSSDEPVLSETSISKNVDANFSSTNKIVANIQNANKLKSINISTSETRSKSPNLKFPLNLPENSTVINKICDNITTSFLTVPIFSSASIVSSTSIAVSQSFSSSLTNINEKVTVNKCDQQSSFKGIIHNTHGITIIQNPICSTTSTVQKVPITVNSQTVSLHSQNIRPTVDHNYTNVSSIINNNDKQVTASRKRKNRDPDYFKMMNGDSDPDDIDELIFKSAKIEYTNVDGTKSLDDFSCSKCPAQFESRVGLTNHMKLHGAKKQFPCDMCDFCCTNKKTMRLHRRIHGIIKPKPKQNKGQPNSTLVMSTASIDNKPKTPMNFITNPPIVQLEKSPNSLAEMEPKIRAIDLALRLNLDEDGNPKPMPKRPIRVNNTFPSVDPLTIANNNSNLLIPDTNLKNEVTSSTTPLSKVNINQKDSQNHKAKCSECPFGARSQKRLQPHLLGHTRSSGYICPLCTFKSESLGFLKRHCNLHGVSNYKWPPDYVGTPHLKLENLLARERSRLEIEEQQNAAREVEDCALANAILGTKKDTEIDVLKNNLKLKKLKLKLNLNLSSESSDEKKNKRREKIKLQQKILVCRNCNFKVLRCFRFDLVRHKLKEHRNLYLNKKLLKKRFCLKCGLLMPSYAKHIIHKNIHHPLPKIKRSFYSQILNERLNSSVKQKEESLASLNLSNLKIEKEISELKLIVDSAQQSELSLSGKISTTLLPDTPSTVGDDSFENKSSESIDSLKKFNCSHCPFSCNQIVRLSRHENKHYIKADHQCSHCTFSCRSIDILIQHLRLHIKGEGSSLPTPTPSNENLNQNNDSVFYANQKTPTSFSSTTKSQLPIAFGNSSRKNDLLQCTECPYKSKHGCDMKAHLKMHQAPPRTFSCRKCTYSAMRLNALKSHELLHEGIQPTHIREEEERKQIKIKLLEFENRIKPANDSDGATAIKSIFGLFGQIVGKKFKSKTDRIFYCCKICKFEVNFYADLLRHSKHHFISRNTRFCCDFCGFKTDLKSRFNEHILVHSELIAADISSQFHSSQFANHKCSECPFTCDTYGKIWHHFQKHKKLSRFTCTQCTFSAGSISCLSEHVLLHAREPPASASSSTMTLSSNFGMPPTLDNSMAFISQELPDSVYEPDDLPPEIDEYRIATTASDCGTNTEELSQDDASSNLSSSNNLNSKLNLDFDKLADAAIAERANFLKNNNTTLSQISVSSRTSISSASIKSWRQATRFQCKDCPFECSDKILFGLHNEMHVNGLRPFKCNICTYNCFNAETLHSHLSLHVPPLSPNSAQQGRKRRYAGLSRTGSCTNLTTGLPKRLSASNLSTLAGVGIEIISANATNVLQCTQCNFRTVHNDRFMLHRMDHVQLLQQRLNTTIKRAQATATNENGETSLPNRLKVKRPVRRTDKMHMCPKCAFKCDTTAAFSRHLEFHSSKKRFFSCSFCDYNADTYNIVLYHEQNHHLEGSMTTLFKGVDKLNFKEEHNRKAALALELKKSKKFHKIGKKSPTLKSKKINNDLVSVVNFKSEPLNDSDNKLVSKNESIQLAPGTFRCVRCNFIFYELRELDKHWEEAHVKVADATEHDRQIGEMLKMNMVPRGSISIVV